MAQTVYLSPITMIVQYLTNLGVMAQGGTLTLYLAGSSTLATTYTDSTGVVPNPNPMTLNQAGRPATAGGAPTAFWTLPGVVLKLSVVDAQGNQLVGPIDGIAAIGDLTNITNSLQTLLASPASSNVAGVGPVAGADLVANALKSYDIFADVRAANVPSLASGQTLTVDVQGATVIGDGQGGTFYWSSSSLAADNSLTVLKPNSLAGGSPGRYLRRAEPYPQIFGGTPSVGTFPVGVPIYLVQAADQSVANSTVLINSTNLQNFLNAQASGGNAVYLVSARLQFLGVGGTGQGYKVAIAFNGTQANPTAGEYVASANGGAPLVGYVPLGTAGANASISSTTGDFANFDYMVAVSGGGTLSVQFAQQASGPNATVLKAGSLLTITRVA